MGPSGARWRVVGFAILRLHSVGMRRSEWVVLCLNLSGTYRQIIAFCLASLFLSPVITILQFNDNTIMATVVLSYIVMYNILFID